MDFARKQLEKYGWTDGKGLGKHETGIAEALKPKLKRSVTGIGHDPAKDFTEHWWTHLYDKAAGNVQVQQKNGRTKKIKTKDETFKITNSVWRLQQKPQETEDGDITDGYSEYFVKKAVLTNGGSKTEEMCRSGTEADEKGAKDVFKMTDEELFAACGGRTAHKGARHGLKASGKLARIERQELSVLHQPQYKEYSHSKKVKDEMSSSTSHLQSKMKDISVSDLQVVEDMNLSSDTVAGIHGKKTKRKRCIGIGNLVTENIDECKGFVIEKDVNDADAGNVEEVGKKLKKSKRRNDENSCDAKEISRKNDGITYDGEEIKNKDNNTKGSNISVEVAILKISKKSKRKNVENENSYDAEMKNTNQMDCDAKHNIDKETDAGDINVEIKKRVKKSKRKCFEIPV